LSKGVKSLIKCCIIVWYIIFIVFTQTRIIMDTSLNIVELIENNPITKLTGSYQNKLVTKIKENFNDNEQQMFVASFYCYLKYDRKNDFVIDLDVYGNGWVLVKK